MTVVDQDLVKRVQTAMGQELRRSMKGLVLDGHPKPYYMSYLLHHLTGRDVWGRYGAIFQSEALQGCDLYAEVRVGSYKLDHTVDGSLHADMADRESYNWLLGPEDLDPKVVRYSLWKLTQLKFWESLHEYYDKKKILVEQRLREDVHSFSKEKKLIRNQTVEPIKFSAKRWESYVRDASALFKKHKKLVDPYVRIRGATRTRIFVNSEGSKFIAQENYFELILNSWSLSDEGVYLNSARFFYGRTLDELPKLKDLEPVIDEIARDLASLRKAESLEPYAGPALLAGAATGLIFHEAIGHRLEGERLVARSEGQTFAKKIGQRILPESVTLIDDPTLKSYNGQSLYGQYDVDDEGVASQPVTLVEDGVLKNFLMSRTCIPGFERSNGHGRHERFQDPMARMANLVVKSTEKHSWDELKDRLCKLVSERNLPYGIMVKRVSSGETRTDNYDFQAFKGVPTEVYAVDPKTGKERRVRDVSFIGTPLAAIQKIRGFGEDYDVDNSYCYAESGSVPVSTVAPSMLVEELELQRAQHRRFRPPLLTLPPLS